MSKLFCSLMLVFLVEIGISDQTDTTKVKFVDWNCKTDSCAFNLRHRWNDYHIAKVKECINRKESLYNLDFLWVFPEEYDKFKGLDLRGIDLKGIRIQGLENYLWVMIGSTLFEFQKSFVTAHFEFSNLASCTLSSQYLTPLPFYWPEVETGLRLQNATLDYSDLSHATLDGVNLDSAKLRFVTLIGADLIYSSLINTDLRASHLDSANMGYSNLRETDLRGASFTGTTMYNITLQNPYLRDVDISKMDLRFAQWKGFELGEDMNLERLIISDIKTRILVPGFMEYSVGYVADEQIYARMVENIYANLSALYKSYNLNDIANQFHYRKQVVERNDMHIYISFLDKMFFDWTYGYGSKPFRLLYSLFVVIFTFAIFYFALIMRERIYRGSTPSRNNNHTRARPKLYIFLKLHKYPFHALDYLLVHPADLYFQIDNTVEASVKQLGYISAFQKCLYFSFLTFFNLGYGSIKLGEWLRLWSFRETHFKPIEGTRRVALIEALCGFYLLGLTTYWLFSK